MSDVADPTLAFLGYEIGDDVPRVHDRPDFTGPWRRDDKARCWWRPYRVLLWADTYTHSSRAVFDDGTFWP